MSHFQKKTRGAELFLSGAYFGGETNYTQVDDVGDIEQGGSGSASLGDLKVGGGTSLSAILSGSVAFVTTCLTSGCQETAASKTVTGMTAAYKVFISGCVAACGVMLTNPVATAGGFKVDYVNATASTMSGSSLTVDYFAVRDL